LSPEHPDKGQELGTERTPDEYVAKLVEVFGELWRVLRDEGTLWINISDSYASTGGDLNKRKPGASNTGQQKIIDLNLNKGGNRKPPPGLKPKDLCMIPARLAIALQSWGWYLRQELIWSKDSAMPESVKDRCTRSHEYIYMLTKRPRYFYDSEAIKEKGSENKPWAVSSNGGEKARLVRDDGNPEGLGKAANGWRNARSVWRINPAGFKGSHFATFPPELPMRCIKAGTSEKGVCSECGAPWRRVVEKEKTGQRRPATASEGRHPRREVSEGMMDTSDKTTLDWVFESRTVGWEPTCCHPKSPDELPEWAEGGYRTPGVVPATVLDCFAGSGTTLYAARKLGRRSIGIDLDEKSAELLQERFGNQGVLL
jgi:DNA modification methylase